MQDLSKIFNKYLQQSILDKSEIGDTDVYEYTNTPSNRSQRGMILDNIIKNLQSDDNFKDYLITRKASVKIGNKSFKSGDGTNPLLLLIKENATRGAKVLAILKLIPKPKFKLKPGDLGITRSGSPDQKNVYLEFDEAISIIKENVDDLVSKEKITSSLGEWIKVHLSMFNPKDLSTEKRQKIREVWDVGLSDEITSELLEIFCGLGYIKAITSPFSGQGAILSINQKEKKRVTDIIGINPSLNSLNSFKIWFPKEANYPIIDSQVGYFEGNELKAVFPISTKNVTGGKTPNTIKFKDVFTNKRQVLKWKKGLPKKSAAKQGVQTVVATQAVGQPSKQDTLYPIYAAKSILESNITNSDNKKTFMNGIHEYSSSSSINEYKIKSLLKNLTASRHKKDDRLNDILSESNLIVAKELIYGLIIKTVGTSSPYSAVARTYEKKYLLSINESVWNSVVRKRGSAEYPYTVGNLSLFFEKTLEKNSIYASGPTDYLRMVKENYFTGNRSLISKYGTGVPPSGAGDVILSKVSIGADGIARITYNTRTNPETSYGLRSKNSLNNLQDTLGIAP